MKETGDAWNSQPSARRPRRPLRQPKVCLISTSGGHLAQLEALSSVVEGLDAYIVTVRSPHTAWILPDLRKHFVRQILRNPVLCLVNLFESMGIVVKERPTVVVTTGAGDALPTVILAACLGIPVAFVESMARVERPSLSGQIAYRFARLFVVQWPALLKSYPHAILASPIFRRRGMSSEVPENPSIVVLTGTHTLGFKRLLRAIDELLEAHTLRAQVFAQIGHSSYVPRNYGYTRFLPHRELVGRVNKSDLVVTHDGSGSIGDALEAGKSVIVVPRDTAEREVSYHSTTELARQLKKLGWIRVVDNPWSLPDEIRQIRSTNALPLTSATREVVEVVKDFLRSLNQEPRNPSENASPLRSESVRAGRDTR